MSIGGRPVAGRRSAVVAEPRSAVVEVHDADADVVYIVEPVTGHGGPARIDTTGAADGDVLTAGPDGVFRPAAAHHAWSQADDVRFALEPPTDAAPVGAVHVDMSTGTVYRNGED